MTKVFVTKYALTKGPFAVEADVSFNGAMASWKINGYQQTAHGNDFWMTEDEAIADCERRRLARLESIDKQRKKLEEMKFTIAEQKAN
ncbi:hypothetical protein [Klebsiella sp. 2680]|uniref:hypothetical protein n=1 Tax=Klebsiella sp. 2680 TaxID=2018037 RepID=UPI00115ADA49|nr:hypothetical protein [Klebsiella sp. 2680]